MDKVFKLANYTEDQQNSHLVLHSHVAARSINATTTLTSTGVVIGKLLAKKKWPLGAGLLRANTYAVIAALAIGPIMTEARMSGKSEIEWQDRAWRILQNQNQLKVDELEVYGAGIGALTGGLLMRYKGVGLVTRTVGGAGLGIALSLIPLAIPKDALKGVVDHASK
ncbi:hypothetical protein HDU76_004931 [Blyttiomyces sp. JEL0837]|nr:hypothetical protein HDU76_004931 [Blyttiomyces sp. JEL0837]